METMKKLLLIPILLTCALAQAAPAKHKASDKYEKDKFGNTIIVTEDFSFVIVDATKTERKVASISTDTIAEMMSAGYAVSPANTLTTADTNKAKVYSVDCDNASVTSEENGQTRNLSSLSGVHQTAAAYACGILMGIQKSRANGADDF